MQSSLSHSLSFFSSATKDKLKELQEAFQWLKQKLEVNKHYFSSTDYQYYCRSIEEMSSNLNKTIKPQEVLSLGKKYFQVLSQEIEEKLTPESINSDYPAYQHLIQRVCYRGDNRPPIDNGKGIFEIGFTKKNVDKEYANRVDHYIKKYGENNKVVSPLDSNRATTVAVSRAIGTAALLPLLTHIKLKTFDVLNTLNNKLNEKRFYYLCIDLEMLINFYFKGLSEEKKAYVKDENFNSITKDFLIDILCQRMGPDIVSDLIKEIEKELREKLAPKNQSWIYVVYVQEGFDVSSRGYLAAANEQFKQQEYHLLFGHELCTEKIPPHHVIAALQIERNLKKIYGVNRPQVIMEYAGEGKFLVKTIQYNDLALDYFRKETKKGVDIEQCKKLLEKFVAENQKKGGTPILVSKDGYHRNNTKPPEFSFRMK